MNKKGFTLVELLAVLTILAIISLITIPILVGTINKSKEQSYMKSIVSYGKSVENAIETKRVDTMTIAKTIEDLKGYINTSGNTVVCDNEIEESENGGIVLRYCKVVSEEGEQLSENQYKYENGKVTKETEEELAQDENPDETEELMTTYKEAVEYAVELYKLKNGDTPKTLKQLIDESVLYFETNPNGKTVECDDNIEYDENNKIKINNCRVVNKYGRVVKRYKEVVLDVVEVKEYSKGEHLTIHDEGYYVLSDHDTYVTLLKENPLTVDEVNLYGGVGTDHNHVNRYTYKNKYGYDSVGKAYDDDGYGGMVYYSSETCGYINETRIESGCESENASSYETSDIKYVVDAWKDDKFTTNELAIDTNGYKARLITIEELESFGYVSGEYLASWARLKSDNTPSWIWNSRYWYWTMSPYDNSSTDVWLVDFDSYLYTSDILTELDNHTMLVRPVINIYKYKL